MTDTAPIPVTLLTGFLGAGKTTLLNRILQEPQGQRIAVIENEFGETGIDNELLIQAGEQIVEMNNGCICCTVRGDLLRILGDLADRREVGDIRFDRVVIETTGLADPAPVAQTFFLEENIREDYRLDAILTVVDAKHAPAQLDRHHEAQEQVGFADRILLSKTDLVDAAALADLETRLRAMNPRAPIQPVHFGKTSLRDILDIHGFDLDAILGIEPDFLNDLGHGHDDEVHSFVYRAERPFDAAKLLALMDLLISEFGADLLRYKGILHIAGNPNKIVFQGVHRLLDESLGAPWRDDEKRESVLVFIGRNLPREQIVATLKTCHAHG
ncbi:CobW family GTP-binding protein [Methylomagnum ishizawai]|uniref:CobW family GTP-binding protein n=1 Tax=Methylomagnum ishizawai TaxID=1760988 RepID=UPI001C326472|nr:GTP-binding protein [Methylomagnum ishizawai]BBL73268.1 cobalamin biosynthesis protein CobW [Methylomagnum ishizawai]